MRRHRNRGGDERTEVWFGGEPRPDDLSESLSGLTPTQQEEFLNRWRQIHHGIARTIEGAHTFAIVTRSSLNGASLFAMRDMDQISSTLIALPEGSFDAQQIATAMEFLVVDQIRHPDNELPVYMWLSGDRHLRIERNQKTTEIDFPAPAEFYLIQVQRLVAALREARVAGEWIGIPRVGRGRVLEIP